MYVNVTRQNDLDYLLEVLEEKGYRWMSGTLPTRFKPDHVSNYFYLRISAELKRIAYGFGKGDTGFNEVFDRI